MKKIPLSQGKFALVDDEDFEFLNQFKWHLNNSGYAKTNSSINKKPIHFLMHRLVFWALNGEILDHKNRDKLDNRKENLRVVSHKQNQINRGPHKNNKLQIKGVVQRGPKCFRAYSYTKDKKQITLGHYKTVKEAIYARIAFERQEYGDYCGV